jgi:hypothetical protein
MMAQWKVGVLMRQWDPSKWGCGNTLGEGGEFSLDLSDKRWETGLRSGFDIIVVWGPFEGIFFKIV